MKSKKVKIKELKDKFVHPSSEVTFYPGMPGDIFIGMPEEVEECLEEVLDEHTSDLIVSFNDLIEKHISPGDQYLALKHALRGLRSKIKKSEGT